MTTDRRRLDVVSYNEFVGRFHSETDRAAAVLAGGYLDAYMEAAFRSLFVPNARAESLFEGQGPLRSLGTKIALAVALGIIKEPIARDLDLIRKVRNHFAHHIWEATFESSPVSDWCKAIEIVDASVDSATGERVLCEHPPRIRYLLAVGMTMMMIALSPAVPAEFRERMTGIGRKK